MEFDFSNALQLIGTSAFEVEVQRELESNPDSIPLVRECECGGYPAEPSFQIDEIYAEDENFITVNFTAYFEEVLPGGCENISGDSRQGNYTLTINRATGGGTIDE